MDDVAHAIGRFRGYGLMENHGGNGVGHAMHEDPCAVWRPEDPASFRSAPSWCTDGVAQILTGERLSGCSGRRLHVQQAAVGHWHAPAAARR